MENILTNAAVEDVLNLRLPKTKEFQKCSFILPDGSFYKMYEHYEAYNFLTVEQLVPCKPDAEQLLSDLGYIRYSWVGYLVLNDKAPTSEQYKSLELALIEIARLRGYDNNISVQLFSQPRFYMNFPLNDIPNIIRKIKLYYKTGNLLP